ncbi:MAG: methyltransferase [Acidimicrobiaceae bacterium]|nr:methyltransferase [Acidimicrobiaceae bacterium]
MLTVDLGRAEVGPGLRVLDLGCGGGRHAYACARAGADVVALDADLGELAVVGALATATAMAEAGELERGGTVSVVAGDANALPFAAASFDRVIAAEVLEHLVDDAGALAELARVLSADGLLAISVPRTWPEAVNWALSPEYHRVEGGHVRIYRRRQLRARLAAAGFEIVGTHHAHALHSPYWWLRCLVGVGRENQRLVAAYHRLLVHEIVHQPRWLRIVDRLSNPLVGKSLVLYCRRAPGTLASTTSDSLVEPEIEHAELAGAGPRR